MSRTSFADAECPIALGLESVGEWWTILILRDVFDGFTRFDDLQRNLGISPSMLARRLKAMLDAGLLTKRRYSEHPPRDEYVLTEAGAAFRPVILALYAWSEDVFVARFRNAVPTESPMPWGSFRNMSEDDLRALYRYFRSLKPARTGQAP